MSNLNINFYIKVILFISTTGIVNVYGQTAVTSKYNFSYSVSDKEITVFDDGKETRIQLPKGLSNPVVFTRNSSGEVMLEVKNEAAYISVQGIYSKLLLRWSSRKKVSVKYSGVPDSQRIGLKTPAAALTVKKPVANDTSVALAQYVEFQKNKHEKVVADLRPPEGDIPASTLTDKNEPVAITNAKETVLAQIEKPQVIKYEVSPADQNFRKVLTRWAQESGWSFEAENWVVGRDIPVGGSAVMLTEFKTAVKSLLKSTLLTDLPVQPCFYTNKVLRVIPASELCMRSVN
jgi:hypothetical protein